MSDSLGIISLDSALSMLKDDYKKRCFTIWKQFTVFCGEDYEEFPPGEVALYGYFKSLREDKNMASSSILFLWYIKLLDHLSFTYIHFCMYLLLN